MTTIKIEPIELVSGNNKVIITGIRPMSEDCFVGVYWNGQDGPHDAGWNWSGYMRDGVTDLDFTSETMADLLATAKRLGGR